MHMCKCVMAATPTGTSHKLLEKKMKTCISIKVYIGLFFYPKGLRLVPVATPMN